MRKRSTSDRRGAARQPPAPNPQPPTPNLQPLNAREIYDRLLAAYGPQGWWPARTPFEVVVGAILTQHTSWTNVERALARLAAAGR